MILKLGTIITSSLIFPLQVSFRLEFEFNRALLLDHIQVVMATTR